ncbi:MAG: hypothetical protein ACYCZO_02925 [Daejeonella sp.]
MITNKASGDFVVNIPLRTINKNLHPIVCKRVSLVYLSIPPARIVPIPPDSMPLRKAERSGKELRKIRNSFGKDPAFVEAFPKPSRNCPGTFR